MEVYRITTDAIRAMGFQVIDKPIDGFTWLTIPSRGHQSQSSGNVAYPD